MFSGLTKCKAPCQSPGKFVLRLLCSGAAMTCALIVNSRCRMPQTHAQVLGLRMVTRLSATAGPASSGLHCSSAPQVARILPHFMQQACQLWRSRLAHDNPRVSARRLCVAPLSCSAATHKLAQAPITPC